MLKNTTQAIALALVNDLQATSPSWTDAARDHVTLRSEEWARQTQREILANNPFVSREQELAQFAGLVDQQAISKEEWRTAVQRFDELCRLSGRPFNPTFWEEQHIDQASTQKRGKKAKTESHQQARRAAGLLVDQWRETLDRAISAWELQEVTQRRAALRNELEAFLELMSALARQLDALGVGTGILVDLSKGQLSPQNIDQLKRWARYLANDEGIKALCDVLGKLRQLELSERIEQVNSVYVQDVWQPDPNSREEIIGVRLGRDLEQALPCELAMLGDPDTAVLFDLKYIESRLMCFDMRGLRLVGELHERVTEQHTTEADKLGPMIICVDTSGSMHGMPETIGKAMALYMAGHAREQKRDCYLINFSTSIETLDLSQKDGMQSLMRFLEMSFHGGTDMAPALRHAVGLMQQEKFAKADLLVISDFVAGRLPADVRDSIEKQRINGNRFHSLVIAEGFHLQEVRSLFDQEWVYDPYSSQISELVGFQRAVTGGSVQ